MLERLQKMDRARVVKRSGCCGLHRGGGHGRVQTSLSCSIQGSRLSMCRLWRSSTCCFGQRAVKEMATAASQLSSTCSFGRRPHRITEEMATTASQGCTRGCP